MMAFNPAGGAFNAATLAALAQAGSKLEPDMNTETAMRLFQQGGVVFPPQFAFPDALRQMAQSVPFNVFPAGLHPQEIKPDMLQMGAGHMNSLFFDAMGYHGYNGLEGSRRKNATRETTAPLKTWLNDHTTNPYPTKAEKVFLAYVTKMTMTQVSTWFANARRRLKKEKNGKIPWSPKTHGRDDDDDDDFDRERPSSSTSDLSDRKDDSLDMSMNNNRKRGRSPGGDSEEATPLKKKIWSIAEDIEEKSKEDEDPSKKDDSELKKESNAEDAFSSVWNQQMLAMRMPFHPQMIAAMQAQAAASRIPGGIPPNQMHPLFSHLLGFNPAAASHHLNGSFSSDAASVSPSSSHSDGGARPSASPSSPTSPSAPSAAPLSTSPTTRVA